MRRANGSRLLRDTAAADDDEDDDDDDEPGSLSIALKTPPSPTGTAVSSALERATCDQDSFRVRAPMPPLRTL